MSVTDYTEDGQTWTKHQTTESILERTITDLDSSWKRDQIEKAITQAGFDKARIEYSVDGGYSWTPFRVGPVSTENAARVYTMLQRSYEVRVLKLKTLKEQKPVTSTVTNSSFFRAIDNGTKPPQANSGKRLPTKSHVTVVRMPDGEYGFTSAPTIKIGTPIVHIKRTTYYDMSTPNTNDLSYTPAGDIRNKNQMRVRGFVFSLIDAERAPNISHWWPVLNDAHKPNLIIPSDYVLVTSARFFDDEMDFIFEATGAVAVLGGKYIVGWNKRSKFGDQWLIRKEAATMVINRIKSKGGAVHYLGHDLSQVPLETETEKEQTATGFTFSSENVNPRYIMGVREQLKEITELGENDQILEALVKVIDFRNKCVDELKELNKEIEAARDKIGAPKHG